MNKTIPFNWNLIYFGVPISLLLILVFIMETHSPKGNELLSLAITADLLLTIPLVYFLLIRKSSISKKTVIPVMLIGLLIGSYFLPKESQNYLDLYKNWIFPVVELAILSYVVFKIRKTIQTYKKTKNATLDFYDTLKKVSSDILPRRLVPFFATEIAVIYYGFIKWRKKRPNLNEFTYHKKSGTPSLFYAFILIIAVETITLHFLLAKWSHLAAWILTGLSFYTAIQILGFARSLAQRPIVITQNSVILRYGILNEVELSFTDIDQIQITEKPLEKNKLNQSLSPLGEAESHNVIIHLKKVKQLLGLYGIKKDFKAIKLHVDEADLFKRRVDSNIILV